MTSPLLRPVLVTGSFRSGTTWVGRTLAQSKELGWVDEPFHWRHRPGVFAAQTPGLYTYVCEDNEEAYLAPLADTIAGRYAWGAGLRSLRRPIDVGLMAKDVARFTARRFGRRRALLKDPIALFSAPWIARRFDADVVVLVRHPGAIMWSMKRLGWRFNLSHLLRQPLLMRDLLGPWADEMARLAADDAPDLAEEAALVWRVLYGIAERWRDEHPGWLYVTHDELSLDPGEGFRRIFEHCGVAYTDEIAQHVRDTTGSGNPVLAPEGTAHALARDSRRNAKAWKQEHAPDELARLRELCGEAASPWYPASAW